MSPISKRFGRYLKRRREAKRWSLRKLAKRCRIPHNTIYQMETGTMEIRMGDVHLLAKAFGEDDLTFVTPVLSQTKEAASENQGE